MIFFIKTGRAEQRGLSVGWMLPESHCHDLNACVAGTDDVDAGSNRYSHEVAADAVEYGMSVGCADGHLFSGGTLQDDGVAEADAYIAVSLTKRAFKFPILQII